LKDFEFDLYLDSMNVQQTGTSFLRIVLYSDTCMLTGLTLQDMKQATSVASDITWGQPLIDWFAMLGHHEMRKSVIFI
jgi:hypothetical protein